MSRRLLIISIGLAVLASACSTAPPPEVAFGSGQQFVPAVADSLEDVGRGPSLAVGPDGIPYVSYFGFEQKVAPGTIAPQAPIGAPVRPSVDLVSVSDGIFTRGAVAIEAPIQNVSIAFGPAIVPDVQSMTPAAVNGTAIAIGGDGGLHVAWVSDTGIWSATGNGQSFTASQVEVQDPALSAAGPLGAPSIAIDPKSGAPWIAFTVATGLGQEVTVATPDGNTWRTQVVATFPLVAGGPQPSRTAIAFTGEGAAVVAYSDGANTNAVVSDGESWTGSTVERGSLGAGLSAATASDGSVVLAYYSGPQIHLAVSPGGIAWATSTVADAEVGTTTEGYSTGVAAVPDGTVDVAWYDPASDAVVLASGDGASFAPIDTQGTAGGNSPSLAATPDGATVFLAWYDHVNANLMVGGYGETSGLAVAVRSPTPTGAPSPPAPPPSQECEKVQNGEITVVAQGIAFQTTCIQARAGAPFTIHFDNKDAGTQHNVQIFNDPSGPTGTPIFQGDLVTGPNTADYSVDAFDAGTYFFNCVVHPTQMTGKVVAKG